MIKEKKHAVSQAELDLKGLDHEVQVLNKDRTTAVNNVANLEKQYDWIQMEKECVFFFFLVYVWRADVPCRAIVNSGSLGRSMILGIWILGG